MRYFRSVLPTRIHGEPKVVTSGSHMNSGEGTCTLGVLYNFLCFMLLFFYPHFALKICSSLIIFRYALSKGAAAFAVDVEDNVNGGGASGGQEARVKLSPHATQRRNEAKILEEEPTGNPWKLYP